MHFYADPRIALAGADVSCDRSDLTVQGFGGVFFKAEDPKALKNWYDQHLGTSFHKPFGTYFKWRDKDDPANFGSTTFGIFDKGSDYYAPSAKPFMLNFRVNNLEALLQKLTSAGVQQVGSIDRYDYGNFAWIMDPEGNKIELWEPIDEVLEAYEKANP
ncbi:MAG: VOC family protein [Flavobacteriales bacterium]|nr:VOC family protein [Flavobacteriales bacterium]